MFNLVLVTPPTTSGHEQAMLPKLFEAGLQRLHVRKKDLSHEQLAAYLQNIPNAYRRFVVLHQHHDLVPAMNLGGIHYTERDAPTSPISGLPGRTISLAYHQPSQLLACRGAVDYCFLSPVYPSISKPGYQPPQDLADRRALSEYVHLARYPVIALGGITSENFSELAELGFAGAAMLGAVWDAPDPLSAFEEALASSAAAPWNNTLGPSCLA